MIIVARRLSVPEIPYRLGDASTHLQRREEPVITRNSLPDIFPEGPIGLIEPLADINVQNSSDESNHPTEAINPLLSDALVQNGASNEPQSADPEEPVDRGNDNDELEIVEVRTLPRTNVRPTTGGLRRIKQEPGSEGSGNSRHRKTLRSKRATKPTQSKLDGARHVESLATNMGVGSSDQDMFDVDDMPVSNSFSRSHQTSSGAYPSYDTFQPFAHIPDLAMPPSDFSSASNGTDFSHYIGPSEVAFTGASISQISAAASPPPAYQAKSFEQIMAESHATLEERLSSRMTSELTKLLTSSASGSGLGGGLYHLSKRGRGGTAFTLEEAEQNLKTASHEYTKAKQAEERRANKRVKRGDKQEDSERSWSNEKGGGAGGGSSEKGGKGREKSSGY